MMDWTTEPSAIHVAIGARQGAAGRADTKPAISIVIPALDEEQALPDVLGSLRDQRDAPPYEVILADGGSGDRTVSCFTEIAAAWPDPRPAFRVVAGARRGRAVQMNDGARVAQGDALLFLHADTLLPPSALAAVADALRDGRLVGGGFRHRFDQKGVILGTISIWATARARLTRVHYGDQAMFVRRSVFEAVAGFPEVPLFEDLRLARSLRRAGGIVTLPSAVTTSARRLRRKGVLRTGLQFAALRLRHAFGADPGVLRRGYPDVR